MGPGAGYRPVLIIFYVITFFNLISIRFMTHDVFILENERTVSSLYLSFFSGAKEYILDTFLILFFLFRQP